MSLSVETFNEQMDRLRRHFPRPVALPEEDESALMADYWDLVKRTSDEDFTAAVTRLVRTWEQTYNHFFPSPAEVSKALGADKTEETGNLTPFERWCRQMDHRLREIPKPKWKPFVDAALDWGRNHPQWGPLAKRRFWMDLDRVGQNIEETRRTTENDMREIRKQDESFWRCVFRYFLAEKLGIAVPRQEEGR